MSTGRNVSLKVDRGSYHKAGQCPHPNVRTWRWKFCSCTFLKMAFRLLHLCGINITFYFNVWQLKCVLPLFKDGSACCTFRWFCFTFLGQSVHIYIKIYVIEKKLFVHKIDISLYTACVIFSTYNEHSCHIFQRSAWSYACVYARLENHLFMH